MMFRKVAGCTILHLARIARVVRRPHPLGVRLDDRSAGVPTIREGAEKLEGYFVISAGSLDEAVSVAKTCPHAARGGRIVVRPVAPT